MNELIVKTMMGLNYEDMLEKEKLMYYANIDQNL